VNKKLFSEFAASTLLERDRQTIARALRNTPPDGKERGQPRWKMSTIVTAMERHNRANGSNAAPRLTPIPSCLAQGTLSASPATLGGCFQNQCHRKVAR
jgi:hypothetical protein